MKSKRTHGVLLYGSVAIFASACGGPAKTKTVASAKTPTASNTSTATATQTKPSPPAISSSTSSKSPETAPYSEHETVFFAEDSQQLDEQAKRLLSDEISWLSVHPQAHIVVYGYASDDEGTPTETLTLANARGNAIRTYFVSNGVGVERISVISKGASGPELAPNIERRALMSVSRRAPQTISE